MSEFIQPFSTKGATELLPDIPEYLGEEREDHLHALFVQGQFPGWLRMWHEVNVRKDDQYATFYVMPDFLCIGEGQDYCYTPMGAMNAERVLSLFNAVLPTPKMVDDIYKACRFKQVAATWGPPYDSSMTRTSRWPVQTTKVWKNLVASGACLGDLVEGHMKNVVVSEKMVAHQGVDLSFWGWFNKDGSRIQGDSQAHGAGYCDYAHGVRGVLRRVVVNGILMEFDAAIEDEEVAPLFTYNGSFSPSSYLATRAKFGITEIKY
jgi:hypothetical protein